MRIAILALIGLLSAGVGTAHAVEGLSLPEGGPWQDAWTMDLRGDERIFVVIGEKNYLWAEVGDFADPKLIDGQDMSIMAKFARRSAGASVFYGLEKVRIVSDDQTLAAAADGSNFFLFGTTFVRGGALIFELDKVHAAPSDANIIASRLQAIPATNYTARLDFATWVAGEAKHQGNRGYWLDAAADIRATTINAAAEQAKSEQDFNKLLQAMTWAIEKVHNTDLAAEIASADWVLAAKPEDRQAIEDLLRERNYILYEHGDERAWMTQEKSLTRKFHARFSEISWKDAEAYFQLGLWAEKYGDVLPRASELAHKAFQAGLRGDPNHNGIRRMLGMPQATITRKETKVSSLPPEYRSQDGFVYVPQPRQWPRSANPVITDAHLTWVDPKHEKTFIAVIAGIPDAGEVDLAWGEAESQLQALPDITMSEPDNQIQGNMIYRSVTFSYTTRDGPRSGKTVLIFNNDNQQFVALRLVYDPKNVGDAINVFTELVSNARINTEAQPQGNPEESE